MPIAQQHLYTVTITHSSRNFYTQVTATLAHSSENILHTVAASQHLHSGSKPNSTHSSNNVYTQQQHIPVTAVTLTHNDGNITIFSYTQWQQANIY